MDWLRSYIGQVSIFHEVAAAPNISFVAAKSGPGSSVSSIASVDSRDGKLNWRRVLPEKEYVTGLFSAPMIIDGSAYRNKRGDSPALLVSVSVRAPPTRKAMLYTHIVRAWDSSSGEIAWERSFTVSRQSQLLGVVCQAQPSVSDVVAVACGDHAYLLRSSNGDDIWKWSPPSGSVEGGLRLAITLNGEDGDHGSSTSHPNLFVVGLLPGRSTAIVAAVSLESALDATANIKQRTISLLSEPASVNHMGIVSAARAVVFVDENGGIAAYSLAGLGKKLLEVSVTSSLFDPRMDL